MVGSEKSSGGSEHGGVNPHLLSGYPGGGGAGGSSSMLARAMGGLMTQVQESMGKY